jgi:hypothetical protein
MGFYNATCSVTKLPILKGELCVMVVFRSSPTFGEGFSLRSELDDLLVDVIIGKYDEVGGIEVNKKRKSELDKYNHLNTNSDYVSFFIGESGWEFGKTLVRFQNDYNPLVSLKSIELIFGLIRLHAAKSYDEIQQLALEKIPFAAESKIIYALDIFMRNNYLTMFCQDFHGRYAGQGTGAMRYWDQFQLLRAERIEVLRKKAQDT